MIAVCISLINLGTSIAECMPAAISYTIVGCNFKGTTLLVVIEDPASFMLQGNFLTIYTHSFLSLLSLKTAEC